MKTFLDNIFPAIDSIRTIHDNFGTRPYTVKIVTERWSKGYQYEGEIIPVKELNIYPIPKIEKLNDLTGKYEPCGELLEGIIKISEISSKYSAEDLNPKLSSEFQTYILIKFNKSQNEVRCSVNNLTYNFAKVPGWSMLLQTETVK
jgi:hypothetical protein